MPPDADELFGEHARFGGGLLCLGRVALGALVGLDDVVARLGFEGFEVREVAVEFAGVGADQLVAFSSLRFN